VVWFGGGVDDEEGTRPIRQLLESMQLRSTAETDVDVGDS
jgi:hypothetical protein